MERLGIQTLCYYALSQFRGEQIKTETPTLCGVIDTSGRFPKRDWRRVPDRVQRDLDIVPKHRLGSQDDSLPSLGTPIIMSSTTIIGSIE
jgi:hypothetical protein